MDPKELLDELGVPIGPARLKCALLSYKVLQVPCTAARSPGRKRQRRRY